MPVTAKFSQAFYDKFGHEAVDELVNFLNRIDTGYRSELKELNEHNFARFDATLEQRVAQLDAKLEQRATQLDAKLEQRVTQLDAKIGELRADMRSDLARMETRLIRWMFVFVATAVLAILGLG